MSYQYPDDPLEISYALISVGISDRRRGMSDGVRRVNWIGFIERLAIRTQSRVRETFTRRVFVPPFADLGLAP